MNSSNSLHCTLNVKLKVRGRFVTAASSSNTPGIDTAIARSANNELMLPFSAVKGKLREAFRDCGQIDQTNQWLGPHETDDASPDRGRLRFSDFIGKKLDAIVPTETRVAFTWQRGSVKSGALQEYESPLASGETDELVGKVRFLAKNESDAEQLRDWVRAGLRMIPQFGSNRTVGFGQLCGVDLNLERSPILDTCKTSVNGPTALLVLKPESAFCVAKHKISENIFESESNIPGNVIKGCIASMIREIQGLSPGGPATENEIKSTPWKVLAKHLDKVRFTTARPTPTSEDKKQIPTVPPLSLVKSKELTAKDGHAFRDVALCEHACLLGRKKQKTAPEFAVDWKDSSDVNKAFGVRQPKTELRVRTAIDESKRRAQDSQLFAYEMIRPDGFEWVGSVHLDTVPKADRSEVLRALTLLTQIGIWGIGKSKTFAGATLVDPATYTRAPLATPTRSANRQMILTLQSPALMHNPSAAHFGDLPENASRQSLLRDAYETYWASDSVSGGVFRMKHFFAVQQLAGGDYLGHRFMKAKSPEEYQPYVLTVPGSVFVLEYDETQTDKANGLIETWLSQGIPLSPHIHNALRREVLFSDCPYRPQEGFGEILVNLAVHTTLSPQEREKGSVE